MTLTTSGSEDNLNKHMQAPAHKERLLKGARDEDCGVNADRRASAGGGFGPHGPSDRIIFRQNGRERKKR